MHKREQTFYELIRTNDPCRFFLDLEYSKQINPDIDCVSMMNVVRKQLKEIFLLDLGIVLELYSLG